jgi:heme a synthase
MRQNTAHAPTKEHSETNQHVRAVGPILFHGFAAALVIWCGWFVTHLPWLGIPESTSMPILLGLWFLAMVYAGLGRATAAAIKIGISSGVLSAVLGLLILGSKIANPAPGFESLQPPVLMTAAGFLTLGAFLGLIGGLVGSTLPRPAAARESATYLARFATLTAIAMAPLLVIGGLVTSTNSGMAVPDWPNTFGSNMFLYPLGPRAAPGVYFEHSHRLFGTFVGLTMLTLMVWILVAERREWVRFAVVLAFVLVCIQGILGGIRVLEGSTELAEDRAVWRIVHGVLAQIVFGLTVTIAVVVTPTYRRISPPALKHTVVGALTSGRALRFYTTGLLHSMVLQLLLGAIFRHARHMPVLWTHAVFAIIIVVFASASGFAATNIKESHGGAGPILRRTGQWIVAVVALQFLLGWLSFGFGGFQLEPSSVTQALIRTLHQANGALLGALAVIAFTWTRRLLRASRQEMALEATPAPRPEVAIAP